MLLRQTHNHPTRTYCFTEIMRRDSFGFPVGGAAHINLTLSIMRLLTRSAIVQRAAAQLEATGRRWRIWTGALGFVVTNPLILGMPHKERRPSPRARFSVNVLPIMCDYSQVALE